MFRNLFGINQKKVFLIILIGINLPSAFANKKSDADTQKKSRFEQLELFNKVIYLVESSYYRDVDTEKLIQGAIKGMMETLDPHSAYLPKETFTKMQNETKGEFGGLGIEVTSKDGYLYVISPIDDTPAYRAGIKAGDKIVDINGESTLGFTLQESVKKMRGKPKSKVTLGIVRKGVQGVKYFDIHREVVKVRPIKFELIDKKFAYIRLTQFTKRASKSIVNALKELKKQSKKHGGLSGIVLDLRNNPGGLLDEAVNVSSIFLNEGIVVSTEGRDPKNKEIRYVNKSIYKETQLPLVLLVNGSSASASEIVAGALQDHKRALVMGIRSFGKGSVQQVAKIDEWNGVKLTIAQYMTPNGRKIQAMGIVPDIDFDKWSGEWVPKKLASSHYVREEDLRNHLAATIETDEEKTIRLKREKERKKMRIEEIRRIREGKAKEASDEPDLKRYKPKDDYQVKMAINQLRTIRFLKEKQKK